MISFSAAQIFSCCNYCLIFLIFFISFQRFLPHFFLICCSTLIHSSTVMQQGVLDGKYDDLSEQSFYMVGGIEEVIAKAEKIARESAA